MQSTGSFAVRLNEEQGYRFMFDKAFERFDKVIGVFHTGKGAENPHFHFIVHSDMKVPAFRAHLKLFFKNGKGNRHMSIKQCDGNPKAWSYLFHEYKRSEFYVCINKGYTPDNIQSFKEDNDKVVETIAANAPNLHIKAIYDDLVEQGCSSHRMSNEHAIFMAIFRHYKNQNFFPNKYQCERYILKIQAMFCQTDFDFEDFMNERYNIWFSR